MWNTPAGKTLEALVGARLRDLRTARGVSQAELAERMVQRGFSWRQTTVAKTEAADRPIRINEAAALALALEVDIFDLLSPHDDSEEEVESLQDLLKADTALSVAHQRVEEAERALAEERERLAAAESELDRATRRFHEVRGIDHDEVQRGVDPEA